MLNMSENVQQSVHDNLTEFKNTYTQLLQMIISARVASGLSKKDLAEILNEDRRKITALENGVFCVELMLKAADFFSIEIKLTHQSF